MSERNVSVERATVIDKGNGLRNEFAIWIGFDNIEGITVEEMTDLYECIGRLLQHESAYEDIEMRIENPKSLPENQEGGAQ